MNCVSVSWVKLFIPLLFVCFVPKLGSADSRSVVEGIGSANYGNIVILQPEDPHPDQAIKVTTIEVGDAKTGECSYSDLLNKAKAYALASNANIIKINELKAYNKNNIYDYLSATLYKADDPKRFQKEIVWSKDRKLNWDDFKGPAQSELGDMVAAATYCGFGFETNQITDKSAKLKILVYNSFYIDRSWAHKEEQTPEILQHEQCHFDICELYTRKLRERMNGTTVNTGNLNTTLERIYDDIKRQYSERQERYEEETEHGLIQNAQKKWETNIAMELKATENWAQ